MAKRAWAKGLCGLCGKSDKEVSDLTAEDRAVMIVCGWEYVFRREPEQAQKLCAGCIGAYLNIDRGSALDELAAGKRAHLAPLLNRPFPQGHPLAATVQACSDSSRSDRAPGSTAR
jgi:hypothetical protein